MKQQVRVPRAGFTLTELIVIISILAILATIAFLSFQSSASSARDSKRVSEINSLAVAVETDRSMNSTYPEPSGSVSVTYSGVSIWRQWRVWDSVMRAINRKNVTIEPKPVDPLTNKEYSFSVSAKNDAFELSALLENNDILQSAFIPHSYAEDNNKAYIYIKWNYNQIVAETRSGGTVYVIATPSITIRDTTKPELTTMGTKNLAIHGSVSSGSLITFSPWLAWSGTALPGTDPKKSMTQNTDDLKTFIDNVRNMYSGSELKNQELYAQIINKQAGESIKTGADIVTWYLGGKTAYAPTGWSPSPETLSTPSTPSISNPEGLKNMFSKNTDLTKYWGVYGCDPSKMAIDTTTFHGWSQDIISNINLQSNTIYWIPKGTYTLKNNTAMLAKGKTCIGLIGADRNATIFQGEDDGSSNDLPYIEGSTDYNSWPWKKTQNMIISNLSFTSIGRTPQGFISLPTQEGYSTIDHVTIGDLCHGPTGGEWYNCGTALNLGGDNTLLHSEIHHGGYLMSVYENNHVSDLYIHHFKRGMGIYGSNNNNTFDKVVAHDVGSALFHLNGSSNNTFSNIRTYNIGVWFEFEFNANGNAISNYHAFNSGDEEPISIYESSHNAFTNILAHNNNSTIYVNKSSENAFVNVVIPSSNGGIQMRDAPRNKFANITIVNSRYWMGVGNQDLSADNRFYGTLRFFWNDNNFYETTANDSRLKPGIAWEFLGFWAGNIDTSAGTISCAYHSKPDNLLTWWSTCDFRYNTTISNPVSTYSFGSALPVQEKPVRWNSELWKYENFGTNGIEYNTTKKIWEW